MTQDELSAKMRTYLAEVYRLAEYAPQPEHYVSTSAVAELLDVSAPAVNRMINRLKELGLLEHEPYRGIRLTPEGMREALKQIRNHRIAESFLVQVMGLKWDEVYSEAQQISAALSDTLIARMEEMAGHPRLCPHGEPIPDAQGTIPPLDDCLLSDLSEGAVVEVTRLRTREPDRLNYIAALGLLPGTKLELLHAAPFNGPMQLRVGGEYRIIGHNLAELIRVRRV